MSLTHHVLVHLDIFQAQQSSKLASETKLFDFLHLIFSMQGEKAAECEIDTLLLVS